MAELEIAQIPRITTAANGVACHGGCDFLIRPGEPIWPGRRCTFCKRWDDQARRRRCETR